MAITLATVGKSAQIIPHPRALTQPVIQHKAPGRRPKTIVNLTTWRMDRKIAMRISEEKAQSAATSFQSLQTRLQDHLLIANTIRQQIVEIKLRLGSST